MRRINLTVIICFILSSMLLPETRKSVTVYEFEGGNEEDGAVLTDLFVSSLVNKNVFDVLTKTSVEAILKEHNFQRSAIVDDETVKAMGKIVGADYIIVGKIAELGNVNMLTIQMINVERGNIEASGEITFRDIDDAVNYIEELIENIVKVGGTSSVLSLDEAIAMYEGEQHIRTIKDLVAEDINAKSDDGSTPLFLASWKVYTEIVKALIVAGADLNVKDEEGRTPLYIASWKGRTETVKLLIDAGADLNVKANGGYTPLIMAAWNEHAEIVKLLIDAGADVNAETDSGNTALYIASVYEYTEIVRLLRQARE